MKFCHVLKEEWPKTQDEYIIFKGEKSKLAPRSLQLLQMFLDAEQQQVKKEQIKKLWPEKCDTVNNMTSAVNRLNNSLIKRKCPFTIITDTENKNYYRLTHINKSK